MIDLGPINLFTEQEIKGETWYRITNKNAYSDRNVLFKAKKDKDHIRIICLGGSASAGWPHPPEEIYSRYLEKTLQKVYPEKKIEVINCSAHGFASYRVRQVFETIIPFEPDAVIVWSGNNEFLEGRNYRTSELKNTLIRFRNNFRTLQLVRSFFVKHRYDDTPDVAETFWKKVNEEALELRSDPAQYAKVKEHYQNSISGIVEEARRNDIKLMLMTVPVNLRDWEPNVSFLGLNAGDSLQWLTQFKEGKKTFLGTDFTKALEAFTKAHTQAPLHAETMFWLAKTHESMLDTTKALEYYIKAKDYDYNPFRAISDFNNTLRKLSAENPEVALLDMEERMNQYAHKGLPGFDLFLDYVHPTREGNLAITREVSNHIIKTNLLPVKAANPTLSLEEVMEINRSDYRDEEDMFLQFTRFSLCCMTHQYYSALHFAKFLEENLPASILQDKASVRTRLLHDAISTFQPYVDLELKSVTTATSAEEEKKVMDNIRAFYAKHFPYGVF